MIISRRTHDLIVAEVRNQIAEQKKANDLVVAELRNQVANLTEERNYYRKEWTRARGKAFSRPGEAEHTMPLFDQTPPPTPALDADWTADDRDLFRQWSNDLPPGVNAEDEWRRLYGTQPPLIVLTV